MIAVFVGVCRETALDIVLASISWRYGAPAAISQNEKRSPRLNQPTHDVAGIPQLGVRPLGGLSFCFPLSSPSGRYARATCILVCQGPLV
jgi:hypothetical protein